MDKLEKRITKMIEDELGVKPEQLDYERTDVRKHLNKEGVSVYYLNKLLGTIKIG